MLLSALQPAPLPLAPLPAGTVVGSFVLQRLLSQDDFRLCYVATGAGLAGEVVIEEFAPAAIARRDDDGSLRPCSPAHAALWTEGLQALASESLRFERVGHGSLQQLGAVWQARGTGYRLCSEVAGRTLGETRAAMIEPPSEAWLRRLVLPLLDALEALHGAGGLHGNVHPDSIVMQAQGPAVLIDPGAVRVAIGARMPGPPGWPQAAFVAPELLLPEGGGAIGPWSDLYALAATVRYAIAGSVPMGPGLDNIAALPSVEDWSTGFIAAIAHALARDPARRPQSVAAFRREFEASPAWPPLAAVPASGIQRMTANPAIPPARTDPGERYSVWPRSNFGDSVAPTPTPTPAPAPASAPARRTEAPAPSSDTPARRIAARSRSQRPRRRWPAALAGAVAGAALALGAVLGLRPVTELLPSLATWISIPPAGAAVVPPRRATDPTARGLLSAAPPAVAVVAPIVEAPSVRPEPAPAEPAPVPLSATAPAELGPARTVEPPDEPAAAAPVARPAALAQASKARATMGSGTPRRSGPAALCASRSNFSRYLCIKNQCETARFYPHRQCVAFRSAERLP